MKKIITAIFGIWLMVAPGVLNYSKEAADNGHIIGPIVLTFSIIALWDATNGIRKWNYPFALWLLIAPWILGYENTTAIISDIASGIFIFIFSFLKHPVQQSFGGGWQSLFQKNPEHLEKAKKNS